MCWICSATTDTNCADRRRCLPGCLYARDEAAARRFNTDEPGLVARLKSSDCSLVADFAGAGNTEGVRLLLDLGFDRDSRTSQAGASADPALHVAVWRGWIETVNCSWCAGRLSRRRMVGERHRCRLRCERLSSSPTGDRMPVRKSWPLSWTLAPAWIRSTRSHRAPRWQTRSYASTAAPAEIRARHLQLWAFADGSANGGPHRDRQIWKRVRANPAG